MNAIIIFGFLGTIFLCVILWEMWTWWRARIKSFCLGGVYRLQAILEIRKQGRISGFLLKLAYNFRVARECREYEITTKVKAIKKRETPLILEEVKNRPRVWAWGVDYQKGVAVTEICTDIEIIED